MKYLAPKLKHKLHILKSNQVAGRGFGLNREYERLLRIWGGLRNVNISGKQGVSPVRAENNGEGAVDTHEFVVRNSSLISKYDYSFGAGAGAGFDENTSQGLGKEFTDAFDNSLDSIFDINTIKVDYFIFMEYGAATKGRLFKINRVMRDDNLKEWVVIKCTEVEEQGTGARMYER